MDLFCPHCTRRVSVSDDKAGLITNCPLCAKQFMAPSLAPPPAPKPPPPPASAPKETYGMDAAAVPPPSPFSAPSKPAPAAPPPPLPPGEYTRSFSCTLDERWLAFVPSACVLVIFVLSFFSWHSAIPEMDQVSKKTPSLMMWELGFSAQYGQGQFLAYAILFLPCLFFTVIALVFDKGWIFTPPQLAPILVVKNLLVGLLLGLAFLMLFIDYSDALFRAGVNPIAVPLMIAIRLHFLAMIASFALFWLNWRKRSNLPLPKVEFRW